MTKDRNVLSSEADVSRAVESTMEERDHRRGYLRPFCATVAILTSPLVLPFAAIWVSVGPSMTGWLYLLGFLLVYVGMLTAPWRRRKWRGLVRGGGLLVVVALMIRLLFAGDGETMEFERVGTPHMLATYANHVVPEADSALVGGRLILLGTSLIRDPGGTFLDALSEGYRSMADTEGIVASPWAATYLGLQRPSSFDMQYFPVEGDAALVFLHGFGGNFTLPCWEVAQAARRAAVATFCPSTRWRGEWWRAPAQETIRRTIRLARERGYETVFVAGLSNGGIGLSRTADEFSDLVVGFIFISGISSSAKPVRVPTLVVHGDRDTMTQTAVARRYAGASDVVRYEEFEGGHFILLEHREAVRRTIADWLTAHSP